ncbi:MAG: hypothetical protein K1X72_20910 [Pyrinomonadaceae bacterium]|nr:hypothetical protein [Pyrinomonadaceae bacterium]
MIEVNRIIDYLDLMKQRPKMCIYPFNTDSLRNFLYGLERCFLLSFDESELHLRFSELINARSETIHNRGWKVLSVSPDYEMREKGMPEEEIIQELIEIEIGKWKIWDGLEKKKLN